MTVYFTASIIGKRHYLANYVKIIDILRAKNHQVISDHIIDSTKAQIRFEKKEDRLKFQTKLEKWINSCDFVVAETSFPSISVGYEISLSLSHNKPVLVLYSTDTAPSLLVQHKDEKLICEKYTVATLTEIIDDFINYVQGTSDSRFTFFITAEIASYLEKKSRKEKVPKSVYLRRLIKEDMQNRQTYR